MGSQNRPVDKSGIVPHTPAPGATGRSPLHPLHPRDTPYGDLTPMAHTPARHSRSASRIRSPDWLLPSLLPPRSVT